MLGRGTGIANSQTSNLKPQTSFFVSTSSLRAFVAHFPRSLAGCIALAIVACGAGCDRRPAAQTGAPTKLVVSGDTSSWITPCGCTSNQSGGLLRRATYLKGLAARGPVIYADAGGAIAGTSDYQRMKFEAILRGEMEMGIVAHNIGKAEAALGPEFLRDVARRLNAPLISANALDSKGELMGDGCRVADVAGRRVALIGLLSPKYATEQIHVDDPRAALQKAIGAAGALKDKPDLLIVLAYMPEDELQQLAAMSPEVDAIIGGPTGQAIGPHRVGPTLLAAATNKGKFVVEIDIDADRAKPLDGRVVELGPSFADDAKQRENLNRYLADLAARDFTPDQTGLVEPLPPGTPASYRFAGSASCAACHAAAQNIFAQMAHAHAFETLKAKGMHGDPTCLQCHTTGYGLPGGFVTQKLTPERIEVGCESCHGPSAAHVADPRTHTPFAAADQCVRCHDHENSPAFQFKPYWEKIKHGKDRPQ
jgi:hypothetical protein